MQQWYYLPIYTIVLAHIFVQNCIKYPNFYIKGLFNCWRVSSSFFANQMCCACLLLLLRASLIRRWCFFGDSFILPPHIVSQSEEDDRSLRKSLREIDFKQHVFLLVNLPQSLPPPIIVVSFYLPQRSSAQPLPSAYNHLSGTQLFFYRFLFKTKHDILFGKKSWFQRKKIIIQTKYIKYRK